MEHLLLVQLTALPVLNYHSIQKPWKPDSVCFYPETVFACQGSAMGNCRLDNTASVPLKDDVEICYSLPEQKTSHDKSFYTVLLHQVGQKLLSCMTVTCKLAGTGLGNPK